MALTFSCFFSRHRFSIAFTIIITALLIVTLISETSLELLRYDITAIKDGQFWRLLTGHLVHSNTQHTLLNLAGLWLIAYLFEANAHSAVWGGLSVLMAILSSLGFIYFKPDMQWYVGFSGVLHGLFFLAAISEWPKDRLVSGLLAAFLLGKLIYSQVLGPSSSTEAMIGVPVAEIAHIIGSALGIAFGLFFRRLLFLTWEKKSARRVI